MSQVIQFKKLKKDFSYYIDELSQICDDDLSSINTLINEKINSKI